MKNQEAGTVFNWNCVILSIVVLTVLTLMVLYMPNIREFDEGVLGGIRHALSPYPTYIPIFISDFGYANLLIWPQIAAVCVLVSHKYYVKAFLLVFMTQAAFFLNALIKDFVCRQRPFGCDHPGFSFPSNHAAGTMCFYGIIIYLVAHYVKNDFWRNFLIIFFGVWILLNGISRLWLGVHYPIDIVAGLFLGFLLVNLYIILSRFFSR